MTHTPYHAPHHTWWFKVRHWIGAFSLLVALGIAFMISKEVAQQRDPSDPDLNSPIVIRVESVYKFLPTDRITYRSIKGVGLTYYCRGDGMTPGVTTSSGRHVYDGGIAVSWNLWIKEASPGDLIWVKATNRWYKVEDTMSTKYTESRVDVYTHSMKLANSGSSKTDIIIMRQPK